MQAQNLGKSASVWMETVQAPAYSRLEEHLECDVCVIGAGIAGLSCAYQLAKEGRRVVVLDDGPVGSGETGRTTAHLASALDDRFLELERLHGEDGARLAAQSHSAAIDRIEQIAAQEDIDCDFLRLDGYLFVPPGESTEVLDKERDAARRAGLDVELVERAPIPRFDTGRCLRFARQAQFHPMRYLAGLANAIERMGGRIYSGSHVVGIESGPPAKALTVENAQVTAESLIVATNTPVNDMFVMHTKQEPYRTYAVALRVAKDAVPRALFWDTLDPYHYVRLQPMDGYDLLIVGGEDHKTGQAEHRYQERFARLEAWARERFPAEAVEYHWSGQVMEPVDALGYIGRNPLDESNVYIVTGDSGHGMTHGAIAGILIPDLILGRDNPWAELYQPRRKTLRAGAEFARANLNVAASYFEWATRGEVESEDQIAPGSGAVMRRGFKKVAVYKDESGHVHRYSAACTHLGCVVEWNAAENSWDCPCHGSRFGANGEVLNGPATSGLPLIDET